MGSAKGLLLLAQLFLCKGQRRCGGDAKSTQRCEFFLVHVFCLLSVILAGEKHRTVYQADFPPIIFVKGQLHLFGR